MHSKATERKNINCTQQKYDACNPSMRRRERERERCAKRKERERDDASQSSPTVFVFVYSLYLALPPSLSHSSLSHTQTIFLDVSARTIIEHKKRSHTLSHYFTTLHSPHQRRLPYLWQSRAAGAKCMFVAPTAHSSTAAPVRHSPPPS